MKRILCFILIVCIGLSSIFASDSWTFNLSPADDPLYKEPYADPYSFVTKIEMQKLLDPKNDAANYIRAVVRVFDGTTQLDTQYIDLPFNKDYYLHPENSSIYTHLRTGNSASFFRLRYNGSDKIPSIDFEANVSGAINSIFLGNDSMGFDGTWFGGCNLRIADMYTLRFGMHHFSGHYGDEILEQFYECNKIDFNNSGEIGADFEGKNPNYTYRLNYTVEYVRDNYWITGLSVDLPYGFRTYGEFEFPKKKVWIRPFADVPAQAQSDGANGGPLMDSVSRREGFTSEQLAKEKELKVGSSYGAYRAHVGLEYSHNFDNVGTFYIGTDLQMHQDGQTKHMPDSYSPKNPWELEFTACAGIALGKRFLDNNVCVEVCYHNGRTMTTDFYYARCKTVSIGAVIR